MIRKTLFSFFMVALLCVMIRLPQSNSFNMAGQNHSPLDLMPTPRQETGQGNSEQENSTHEDNWIKLIGAMVRITNPESAELRIFLILEDGWDTLGFMPEKGFGINNNVRLNLPDCFKLDGELVVNSKPELTDKYQVGEKLKVYSGTIELIQKLTIIPGTTDFTEVSVGGNLYCQLHRIDQHTSVPLSLPFVAFCKSNVSEHKDFNRRIPKFVGWVEEK